MMSIAKGKEIMFMAEVTACHLTLTQKKVLKSRPETEEGNPVVYLPNKRQGMLTKFDTLIYDTNANMYPLLRTEADVACLVEALKGSIIDAIVRSMPLTALLIKRVGVQPPLELVDLRPLLVV